MIFPSQSIFGFCSLHFNASSKYRIKMENFRVVTDSDFTLAICLNIACLLFASSCRVQLGSDSVLYSLVTVGCTLLNFHYAVLTWDEVFFVVLRCCSCMTSKSLLISFVILCFTFAVRWKFNECWKLSSKTIVGYSFLNDHFIVFFVIFIALHGKIFAFFH